MGTKKKIAWLDTVRVFASFAIVVAHYLMCQGFETYPFTRRICFDLAGAGVFLFFAISGYLVVGSLDRTPSIWDFCKRKVIRIVVPFTMSFIFLGSLFLLAGVLDMDIAEQSPFYKTLYSHDYFVNLICILPIDMNLFVWLGIDFLPFVGEWFMGVILLMYFVAPLLKPCAERAPLITLAASIVVSFVVFNVTKDTGIGYNWWLVPVRIPEFLFGMILAIKRDWILKYRIEFEIASIFIIGAYAVHFLAQKLPVGFMFFVYEPKVFFLTMPTIYLCFSLFERLNRLPSDLLSRVNDLAGISYPIMLIQHPMIFLFEAQFDFAELHSWGIFFVLIILTWMIIYLSGFVKTFSEPAERFFLRRA